MKVHPTQIRTVKMYQGKNQLILEQKLIEKDLWMLAKTNIKNKLTQYPLQKNNQVILAKHKNLFGIKISMKSKNPRSNKLKWVLDSRIKL
jgi:hypothetical protein